MTPARILETLTAAGVSVRRDGDRLKLKPATGTVPADLVELARTHKAELLQLLPDARPASNILRKSGDLAEQRRRLVTACRAQDLDPGFVIELAAADVDGCQWLSESGLGRYVEILAAQRGCPRAKT